MSDEFLGEYPPFASRPPSYGAAKPRAYVSGNWVAEPGTYVCLGCEAAIAPPSIALKAGQRLPPCARCGPAGRWVKQR